MKLKLEEQIDIYFNANFDPLDLVEIRPLPVDLGTRRWVKASEVCNHIEAMRRENAAGANLYVGMLPRESIGSGSAAGCLSGSVVWSDFDGITPREAWKISQSKGLPEPSLVVASGHGAHLLWSLDAKEEPADISELVHDLAKYLGSDPSVSDLARILRIPGFMNWKQPKAMAEIIYHTNKSNPFWLLREAVPREMPRVVQKTLSGEQVKDSSNIERARRYVSMVDGSAAGGRTGKAYKVAGVLIRDFRIPDDEAINLLLGWDKAANVPPIQHDDTYPPDEFQKIINNVKRYGKHAFGSLADKENPVIRGKDSVKIQVSKTVTNEIDSMKAETSAQKAGRLVTIDLPWSNLSFNSKALRPGSVVIVGGPLKSGKSYFVMNIINHVHSLGHSWKYLPLEDSKQDFGWRLLAIMAEDYNMTDDNPKTADYRAECLEYSRDKLSSMLANVSENPRIGHKDEKGNTVVPTVPPESVIEWARDALVESRIAVVDPMSQVDFDGRMQHIHESSFVRNMLAVAKDSGGTIILVMHTVKRPGKNNQVALSAEDIQGAANFPRLVHTVLMIDPHEEKESEVYNLGKMTHNRTVIIAAARNGPGSRTRHAFVQSPDGPTFKELGMIKPGK